MKETSLKPYQDVIESKGAVLHALCLKVFSKATKPLTQHELAEEVNKVRPGTAYSSARSRVWELERMGLVRDTGVRKSRYNKGHKSACYEITQLGRALLTLPLPDMGLTLQRCMKQITYGRSLREEETKPIKQHWDQWIEDHTRDIIRKALP